MIRVLGAALIVAAAGTVGLGLRRRDRYRLWALRAVESMLTRLRAEISRRTPLREIFASLAAESEGDAAAFFKSVADSSGAFSPAFADAVRSHRARLMLTPAEESVLLGLAPVLGMTDAAGQDGAVALALARIGEAAARESEENARRDRLYMPVSLAVGFAAAVMLL